MSDPIAIQIPASAEMGTHTYYVGIDGTDSTGETLDWTSSPVTITVVPQSAATPTANPSGGSTQTEASPNWLLYGTVIAAAVVLVVLLIVVLMMRKKRSVTKPTVQPTQKPEAPKPEEEKPEEQPDTGKDFNI
jgi:flagellar biosynthesis/type III secretory pathway M-ring protein FliF/YscJ